MVYVQGNSLPIAVAEITGTLLPTVTFTPPLAAGQRVRLLLNERADPAQPDRALRFHRLEPEAEPTAGATTLRFPSDAVEPGTYLVRAQVDGAESVLDLQADPPVLEAPLVGPPAPTAAEQVDRRPLGNRRRSGRRRRVGRVVLREE